MRKLHYFYNLARLENHLSDVHHIKDPVKKKKLLQQARENSILNEEESPMKEGESTTDEDFVDYRKLKKLLVSSNASQLCETAVDSDPNWLVEKSFEIALKQGNLVKKYGRGMWKYKKFITRMVTF